VFDGATAEAPAPDDTALRPAEETFPVEVLEATAELADVAAPVEIFSLADGDGAGALTVLAFVAAFSEVGAFVVADVSVAAAGADATALRSTSSATSMGTTSPDNSETPFCSKLLNPLLVIEIL
jgi:hypothetical protein